MTCKNCKTDFTPYPGKPGYINQCTECATDVPLLGGNMIYTHKTAPELEIKPLAKAKVFASMQERFGIGVLKCITTARINPAEWRLGYFTPARS